MGIPWFLGKTSGFEGDSNVTDVMISLPGDIITLHAHHALPTLLKNPSPTGVR